MTRVKNTPMTIVNEACICVKNQRCPYNSINKRCVKYYIISAAIHYVLGFFNILHYIDRWKNRPKIKKADLSKNAFYWWF